MAKPLPSAHVLAKVDPLVQKRIDAWNRENNPRVADLIEHAMTALVETDELGHRADIFARLPDGTPAVPEAHQSYFDYTTRVWRVEDQPA